MHKKAFGARARSDVFINCKAAIFEIWQRCDNKPIHKPCEIGHVLGRALNSNAIMCRLKPKQSALDPTHPAGEDLVEDSAGIPQTESPKASDPSAWARGSPRKRKNLAIGSCADLHDELRVSRTSKRTVRQQHHSQNRPRQILIMKRRKHDSIYPENNIMLS